jgi:OmcA/MtrC family decaheme c-type cytochrome
MKNYGGALFLGAMLALAGCAGSDGAQGPQGPKGDNGSVGPTGINGATGQKLKLVLNGVVTAPVNGVNTATLTFTIYPAANVCPGGTCDDTLSLLGQKVLYAQLYNPATRTFDTNTTTSSFDKNFSFGSIHFSRITDDGKGAVYTATKASPGFVVETSASAFVYGYVADTLAMPQNGNYKLYNSMSSAAKVYGTIDYASNADVKGCERCHGAPYSKHGYRQAHVDTGDAAHQLPDFASCKVCHTDQRKGSDWAWYAIADDPVQLAADPNGVVTAFRTRYDYTANVMNDTHNSHAFEFPYPQSIANCVVCHKGKLANILTDANFKPMVCKSCHPMYGPAAPRTIEDGRAPPMFQLWTDAGVLTGHQSSGLDPWYAVTADNKCNSCHFAGNTLGAKTFAQLHTGYSEQVYQAGAGAEPGAKWSATVLTTVLSASYDAPSYIATVAFSMLNLPANAIVKPTVVASLYGHDTKDFVISGHSSQFADKTTNMEFTEGATVRGSNPPVSSNSSRLVVTPAAAAQGVTSWTVQLDLSTWANIINSGQVKRVEVAFLPSVGLDPTQLASTTNPPIAVAGKTQTIKIGTTTASAKVAATKIVDPVLCVACHDELGITFHNPNYGSAGVVACRICHFAGVGGSHLEMQSRSIDSYLHAVHSMQFFDINTIDPNDVVSNMRYNDHVDANYPNFAGPLNCESCHVSGTYDVPDQKKSLPGILSKSSNFMGNPVRPIPAQASVTVGPASRACGGCHRAQAINEGDGAKLAAFYGHMSDFGTYADPNAAFTTVAGYAEYLVGGATTSPGSVANVKAERCEICHPTAGTDHQLLFKKFRDGTK